MKARFDEERNITWAEELEREGVNVVYGFVGMKIHAKLCLVVRREDEGVVSYAHIGTGNYNASTAKLYTDMGLFTCHPDICADMARDRASSWAELPETLSGGDVPGEADDGRDLAAALAWHDQSVCRALGEVKVFEQEKAPDYYGDLYSFLVRAGGRIMRSDNAGVMALVGAATE